MARQKVPPSDVAPLDQTGRWTRDYYDIIKQLDSLDPIPVDASFTVTALTPGSTAYTPASGVSKTMTVAAGTPVIQTFLLYGTSGVTAQNILDNFATIADALTKAATNLASIQTAVAALNTRITALENKENDVIDDLTVRFP